MLPELVQAIELDNAGGIIMLAILYIVISFGIFGTVFMMVLERKKEFGILAALGMKKIRLIIMVLIETFMLSGLGILSGVSAGIPILLYMHYHPVKMTGRMAEYAANYNMEPVFPFLVDSELFYNQAIIIFFISIITVILPAFYIFKLKISSSIRGN